MNSFNITSAPRVEVKEKSIQGRSTKPSVSNPIQDQKTTSGSLAMRAYAAPQIIHTNRAKINFQGHIDKLIDKLMISPKCDIRFEEAESILKRVGYNTGRINGSHCQFTRPNSNTITIAKPHGGHKFIAEYNVEDIRNLLVKKSEPVKINQKLPNNISEATDYLSQIGLHRVFSDGRKVVFTSPDDKLVLKTLADGSLTNEAERHLKGFAKIKSA